MQGSKNTIKLLVLATWVGGQRQKHSKTIVFLMQGSKNTVKLLVSATLVGGQRKKRNKTQRFFDAMLQQHNKNNGFINLRRGATQQTEYKYCLFLHFSHSPFPIPTNSKFPVSNSQFPIPSSPFPSNFQAPWSLEKQLFRVPCRQGVILISIIILLMLCSSNSNSNSPGSESCLIAAPQDVHENV